MAGGRWPVAVRGVAARRDGRAELVVRTDERSTTVLQIGGSSARVEGISTDARRPRCYAGDLGSTAPCQAVRVASGTAIFRQDSLALHLGLSVEAVAGAGERYRNDAAVTRRYAGGSHDTQGVIGLDSGRRDRGSGSRKATMISKTTRCTPLSADKSRADYALAA